MEIYFISELWREDKKRLCMLLFKYDGGKRLINYIRTNPTLSDNEYYKMLGVLKQNLGFSKFKGQKRSVDFSLMISQLKIPSKCKILDIGTNDGVIPFYIAQKMNLSQIYATDIEDNFDRKYGSLVKFKISKNGENPFDVKFNIITLFMVLHHVEDCDSFLKNVHDSLSDNGYLIIREHNVRTKIDKKLIDVQHLYNERVFGYGVYFKKYDSMWSWRKKITKVGFKHVRLKSYPRIRNNPTKYYHDIFVKL